MDTLQGKTAVVTGGGGGFGRGIVDALVAAEARVVVVSHGGTRLDALAGIPGVEAVAGDATDAVLAARVIEREKPAVLALVAGANGTTRPSRFHTWETFSVWWDNDVRASFAWAREALLLPLDPGSKVFLMSSMAVFDDSPMLGGYAAAKAAIWAAAHSLASEGAPLGIAVHCLLPVLTTDTQMGQDAIAAFARRLGVTESVIIEKKNLQRPLTPAMVGDTVIRLATDPGAGEVSWRVTPDGPAALTSATRVNPLA